MTNDNHADSNTARAIDTLRRVLTNIGWKPEPDSEASGFLVDLGPPHIPVASAFAVISTNLEQFVFHINFGIEVPLERRDEVSRFITRVNWVLMLGSFEMDYEDGHVRFKSGVDFKGLDLTEELVANTVLFAMNAVERYADALMSVAGGTKDAEQAANIESRH